MGKSVARVEKSMVRVEREKEKAQSYIRCGAGQGLPQEPEGGKNNHPRGAFSF